ncbi:Holliday junction resolvase RecU [Enterococcus asini]|uniref:Holliday junction resolvase RecU n=1 Tax=Enterococcus asini TaxID=57732 RepID=UPI0022DF26C9|nr:Holliday junction resolvase RecU [Enterococcus asini]
MVLNYPDGRLYSDDIPKKPAKQVRTTPPSKRTAQTQKKTNFANRGMRFEEAINESNAYYLSRNLAVIHKKPTPIQIVQVDYPRRSAAVIKEAYFKEASTTDYNGVYKGYYVDFEAKETKNKTSFPLKNFHQHQITHMNACRNQGGITFVLLWFSQLQRCFFMDSKTLDRHWQAQATAKKSIPLQVIETESTEIFLGIAPRIPYLDALDHYIALKEQEHDN